MKDTVLEPSIIPAHIEGKQTDLEQTATLPNMDEATDCFKRAYKRLLNPPVWHEVSGMLSSSFKLCGKGGYELDRLAQEHDYIRVNLHAPGNAVGDGYDWVQIDAMQYMAGPDGDSEFFGLRVRPCANPADNNNDDTAHFFKGEATSTFIIRRSGLTVTASYHGRNELVNTDTESTTANVRNTAVAAAAIAGLSELQWNALIKGLLEAEL